MPYAQTHQHHEHGESHHRRPDINVATGLFDCDDPAKREEHECDIEDEEDDCIPVVLEVEIDVSVTNRFGTTLIRAISPDVQALISLVTR